MGRDDRTVSDMASIRSVLCTLSKESVDLDDDFVKTKRKSQDSKSCCRGKVFNKKTLTTMQSFFPDARDENELNCCRNMLSKTNHHHHNCNNELIDLIKVSNNNPRPDNANTKVAGVQISPLLVGEVKFGKLGSIQVHHVVEELRLRNASADVKIGMRKLTEILKENEHPQWKEQKNSMNDDKVHGTKFFFTPALIH